LNVPVLETMAECDQGGAAVLMILAIVQSGMRDEESRRATLEQLERAR